MYCRPSREIVQDSARSGTISPYSLEAVSPSKMSEVMSRSTGLYVASSGLSLLMRPISASTRIDSGGTGVGLGGSGWVSRVGWGEGCGDASAGAGVAVGAAWAAWGVSSGWVISASAITMLAITRARNGQRSPFSIISS